MQDAGADRIRLCDTVGRTTPDQVTLRFQSLMNAVDIDLEIHAHNDLGLAVANSLAAYDQLRSEGNGRAVYIACTVNGLGERAGNTALEVIAMALSKTRGTAGIDLAQLAPLCAMVARMSDRPIAPNAPVVGINNWRHASGLHVDGIQKAASSYELIDPALVGYGPDMRELVCGQYGGRAALRTMLARHGVTLPEDREPAVLERLAVETVRLKRYLTAPELRDLCADLA